MHILVVDDDAMMVELLQYFLESQGMSVSTASNSHEALQRLHSTNKIDLILSDLVMPGGGGLNLLSDLEKIRPDLPVIMMSGYGSKDLSFPRRQPRGFWRKGEAFERLLTLVKDLQHPV